MSETLDTRTPGPRGSGVAASGDAAAAGSHQHRLADDQLLGCLQVVARRLERPSSDTILTAGLPLEDGRLTVDLLPRAAARVGLVASPLYRGLADIGVVDMPAIIGLRGGRWAVLVSIGDDGSCRLVSPGGGVATLARDDLERIREGEAFTVLPHLEAVDTDGQPVSDLRREHWFWGPVRAQRRGFMIVGLAALMINLIGLAAPLYTMNIYDRVLPNKATTTLWVLALGFAVVLLFDYVLKLARSALLDGIGKTLDVQLSEAIFEKVLNTPLASRPLSTGEFVNRVTQYETIRDFFTANTLTVFIDCLFLFVFLLVIHQLAGWIVLIPVTAMILVVAGGLVAQRMIGQRMAAAQAESSLRHAMLVEAVGALETIKGIRAEGAFLRRWDNVVRTGSLTQEKIKSISSGAIQFSLLVQQMVTVWIVVAGAYRFAAGDMSTGAIIATVMLASRAVSPLTSVATTLTRARHAFSAMTTLDALMAMPDERVSRRTS